MEVAESVPVDEQERCANDISIDYLALALESDPPAGGVGEDDDEGYSPAVASSTNVTAASSSIISTPQRGGGWGDVDVPMVADDTVIRGPTGTPGSRRKKPKTESLPIATCDSKTSDSRAVVAKRLRFSCIMRELWKAAKRVGKDNSRSRGTVLAGLVLAYVTEVFNKSPRYNAIILTVLVGFRHLKLPRKSIRPQIIIALTAMASILLDILYMLAWSSKAVKVPLEVAHQVLLPLIAIAKVFALIIFLYQAPGTSRARKYLSRRFRLFFIPLSEPRRIMRDIRARILAIGWIQFAAVIAYAVLFVVSVVAFSYSQLFVATKVGVTLSGFLMLKIITSGIVLLCVMYDADVVLCLGYFGCLACTLGMKYVKNYTRRKKEELGGWPHAFAFNEMRFKLLAFAKIVDWGLGLLGWAHLSQLFGMSFFTQPDAVKAFVSMILITLTVTDWWGFVLVAGVFWLHGRHQEAEYTGELESSDDSELDDLGVRGTLATRTALSANKKNKKNREREEYLNAHEYKLTSSIKKKVKELLGKRNEDDDAATPLRQRHNGAGGGRRGRSAAQNTRVDEEQGHRRSSPGNDDYSDDDDIGDDSSGGNSSYDDNDDGGDDVDEEGDENNAECDQSREGSVFDIKTPVVSRKRDQVRPTDGRFGHGHGQADGQWDGMEAGVEEQGLSPLHITAAADQFLTTRREADKMHALSPVVTHQVQGSPSSENGLRDLCAAAINLNPNPDQDHNELAGGRGRVLLPSLHNHYGGGSTSKAAKDEAVSDQRFTTTRDRNRDSMRHPSNSTPTHHSPKGV